MNIPSPITDFINAKLTVDGVLCLPDHYPSPADFETFQAGYRYNAITGQNLAADTPGSWQPGWYVICSNYFDDPFFVDLAPASTQEFPVYYAAHGAGTWVPTQVAANLTQFGAMLKQLQMVINAPSQAIELINTSIFADAGLWQEAIEEIKEAGTD